MLHKNNSDMEMDALLGDCIKYAKSKGWKIKESDLQKKFNIGYMRAKRLLVQISEENYKEAGKKFIHRKRKKEIKFVMAQVPSGSICVPPNKIKKIFKSVFIAGMKCQELHPNDDSYDDVHFNLAVDKVFKLFPKEMRPY